MSSPSASTLESASTASTAFITNHRVVSRDEWLASRRALLAREKQLTRLRDEVNRERLQLPWVKIDQPYVFETADGPRRLADLFAGRSQLLIYHFMLGEGWEEGCASCSYVMDHIDPMLPHLAARDITLVVVSSAPFAEIARFQQRMGWKVNWVSAHTNGFNADYGVSFTAAQMEAGKVVYNYQAFPAGPMPVEELPGASAFARNEAGEVFHTYSTYSRGLDPLVGTYQWIDLSPRGRDEDGLEHAMAWVRHHDRYDADYRVDATKPYTPPQGAISRRGCCGGKRHGD